MIPDRSNLINRICRVYAIMLYAYPKAFRIQFGREMQQVFRDGCRAAITNNALIGFLLHVSWDWLWSSARERLAALGSLEVYMKGWWLLALCAIADAMCAGMNLLMLGYGSPGSIFFRFASPNTLWGMCMIALVAGVCAIAVGLWNLGKANSWLVSLHGLALGAFGLIGISPLVRGPLSFRPISLLFVLMAVSLGAFVLGTARTPRSAAPYLWFSSVCGVVSLSFACSFMAVGFGWVRIASPFFYWYWMSSFFGFTALCMLSIAARLHGTGLSEAGCRLDTPVRS